MALLKTILTKKLEASTLLEAVISMVIVMFVFGMGTTIYVNVMNADNYGQKAKAGRLLNELSIETKKKNIFLDEKLILNEFTVTKTITPYAGSDRLVLLSLKAYNQKEKLIAERNELIITE